MRLSALLEGIIVEEEGKTVNLEKLGRQLLLNRFSSPYLIKRKKKWLVTMMMDVISVRPLKIN